MKNTFQLIRIIALAALIGFSMVALSLTGCNTGGGGDDGPGDEPRTVTYEGEDSDGDTYTLVITEKSGRYVAEAGDTYTLTAKEKSSGKDYISEGTVTGNTGGKIKLKPTNSEETFDVTISGEGITQIDGKIKFMSGDEWVLDDWEVTPKKPEGGGGSSGEPPPGSPPPDDPTSTMKWTAIPAGTTDNTTTTFPTTGNASAINAVAYGGGKWVAVGGSGKIAYSTDAKSWTAVTETKLTNAIDVIAYGGGKWVAGAQQKMAYSSDGITWTAVTSATFTGSNKINAIAYGGGKWIAVGGGSSTGQMVSSSNGETWTDVTNLPWENSITSITYNNDRWVVGGLGGRMAYSTNGTSWTTVADLPIGGRVEDIAYGNGRWIAVGGGLDSKKIAYSGNLTSWTSATLPKDNATTMLADVAYGDGKWVATGFSGRMWYSTNNGASWEVVPPGTANETTTTFGASSINDVAWNNGRWIAVGASGKMAYSDD